jgi:selenocysteine-specific elongation factor
MTNDQYTKSGDLQVRHIIVGTAGHIDHGKTALIKALSGFEGDTLEEEKRRGITINLSFSNLQNEDTNIAFIDVPGHEKLIKNMIAGAFGFDASMVVIDANEGIMPQTNEHLEILNLLRVQNIIIALTKSDLANKEIIAKKLKQIPKYLENFPNLNLKAIVAVSIYDQNSIENLKKELFSLPTIEKRSNGLFRYYVDRNFSLPGIGSVVTGTVLDGEVSVGDKIFIAEKGVETTIKNIQVHEQDVKKAYTSQRAALNLQNPKNSLKKGLLLSKKGYIRGFNSADVWCESISNHKIKHNTRVIFYVGTKQIEAKILLYENADEIENGFARVQFKDKIFLVFDEPFIISNGGRVVAGGRVLNPINDPIKKKTKLPLLKALKEKDYKNAFKILINSHKKGFGLISSNQRFGLNHDEALAVAKEIEDIFVDEKELVLYPSYTKDELIKTISKIYDKNQYALLSAKSLSLKIKWASESLIDAVLKKMCSDGILVLTDGIYKNANIKIDDMETLIQDKIYDILRKDGITPKAPYNIYDELDIDRKMGDNALKKLTTAKKVVRLAHNLFVTYENLTKLMTSLKNIIKNEGFIDIATFKKHYNISRKYLIAYLEHLDKYSDIKKDGTKRIFA